MFRMIQTEAALWRTCDVSHEVKQIPVIVGTVTLGGH